MGQRRLDDDDGKQGGVGIFRRTVAGAPSQFFRQTYWGGPGDIDIDVVLVLGVDQERVGVRAATGLNIDDLFRVRDIADIEDADTLDAVRAGRIGRTLCTHGRGARRGGA